MCTLDEEVLHVHLRHASLAALARLGSVSRLWYGVLLRVHGGGALFDMRTFMRDYGIDECNYKIFEDCAHLLHVNTDIGSRNFVDLGVVVDLLGARLKTECRFGTGRPSWEEPCPLALEPHCIFGEQLLLELVLACISLRTVHMGFWFEEIDGSDAPAAAAAVSPEVYLYDVAGFTQFKQSRPPIVCTLDEEALHVHLRHASLAALARLGSVISRLWYGVLLRVHGGGALFDMRTFMRDYGIDECNYKIFEDCEHLLHVHTDIGSRNFVDLGVVVDLLGA